MIINLRLCVHTCVCTSCVGSPCNSTAVLIPERYALDNQQPGNRSGSTTPIQARDPQLGELVSPKPSATVHPVSSQLDDVDDVD